MAQKNTDIVFDNWKLGLGNSPQTGYSKMQNVDPFSWEGGVQLNTQMLNFAPLSPVDTITFTANAGTDIITTSSPITGYLVGSTTGLAVTFTSTGTLPAGLSLATQYFLIAISLTTFQLATTANFADSGTPVINITGTGTGVHTLVVTQMKMIKDYSQGDYLYILDTDGKIWYDDGTNRFYLLQGNTSGGNAIEVWENYLIVFGNSGIDVWGSLTTSFNSRAWTIGWQTMNQQLGDSRKHVTLSAKDRILYFSDKNTVTLVPFVGTIAKTGTFDPASAGTYTFNNQALDLEREEYITSFVERGTFLMIGTVEFIVKAWDRFSDSFSLGESITLPEPNVGGMVYNKNITYIVVQATGNIYASQGSSSVQLVEEFPYHLYAINDAQPTSISNNPVTIGGIINFNNGFLFTAYSFDATLDFAGTYYYDTLTGALVMESYASTEVTSGLVIGPPFSQSPINYYVSSYDSNGGTNQKYLLDNNSGTYSDLKYWIDYNGIIETELRQVSETLDPRNFEQIEVYLAKPLNSQENIRVSFRLEYGGAWTQIATFSTAGASYFQAVPNIEKAVYVQLKIELDGSSSGFPSTPVLLAIRLS